MKSFRELTVAAKQSRLAGISRETFLANLHPSERSDADGETLSRIVTGRIMSAGMLQEAGTAIRHANELTEEDIHAAMADARRNLHADEDYLAARLGLAALAH